MLRISASGSFLLPLDPGQPLDPDLFQRRRGEIRLAQELAHQLDHRRQAVAPGRDVDADRLAVGGEADVGLQAVELIGDLLARHAGAALVEQRADEAGDRVLAVQRRHVAEAQAQPRLHRTAARALGQERDLEAAVEDEALSAGVEVRRGRVERLGLHRARVALVVLDQRRDIDPRRRRRPFRLRRRQVDADGAVVAAKPLGRDPADVGERHLADVVALRK